MFTGIVGAMGRVRGASAARGGRRLAIDAGRLPLRDVAIGDSIAVNGVCLTVTAKRARGFDVDVSPETLACTTGLTAGCRVNLEKALRLADRLGGHLVTGHVDGVGGVRRVRALGANRMVTIEAPAALARYLARKGSVTVNGVSLTVNAVSGRTFTVNLIPHTLAVTTLGELRAGAKVNLEVDILARYIERLKNR